MPHQPPPPEWGKDEVTAFFDVLRDNMYATFHNMKPQFAKVVAIDRAFRTLQENLHNTPDWFAAFFLLRAHSNYLAAAAQVTAGQHPESFAALRSCLESGLYGVYLSKNPGSRETWLRRHDSEEYKRKVKAEFQLGRLLEALAASDAKTAEVARTLYDRTIDLGAHPNERALMQSLQLHKGEEHLEFKVVYCGGPNLQFELGLRTVAQVGVCILSMFQTIFLERYQLTGLTEMMQQLKEGL